jgi:glycosyltransferase involved in cell wall biosynthesis
MRLVVVAHIRLPSELAHTHQIMQMCEAFAEEGADVTLLCASLDRMATHGLWRHYDVAPTFRVEGLVRPAPPRLTSRPRRRLDRLTWTLGVVAFSLRVIRRLARERDAIVYSRDALPMWAIGRIWPGRAPRLFFEAHTCPTSRWGRWLRRQLARRIGGMVLVTGHLRRRHAELGLLPKATLVAHDGVRLARFAESRDRADCRSQLGWPAEALIIGYAGRVRTMGEEKGLTVLARAVKGLVDELPARPVRLAVVGGPEDEMAGLLGEFERLGLPRELVLHPGSVPPADLPRYLRALDVCTIPFPWTEHFAYEASPLKLFEYMASGSPIVASDLPALAEVLHDGANSMLVPPGDVAALTSALRRLADDPSLGGRLAGEALRQVGDYSWRIRARRILEMIGSMRGDAPPTRR